jgi:hypothetical protein
MIMCKEHGVVNLTLFTRCLSNPQDLTQQFDQLNACSTKWAFMFVSSTGVF